MPWLGDHRLLLHILIQAIHVVHASTALATLRMRLINTGIWAEWLVPFAVLQRLLFVRWV